MQIIRYWLKLVKTDNIILLAVYENAKERLNQGKKGWLYNIRKLLDDFGFSYVFDSIDQIHENRFISEFKQRVKDNFYQKWFYDLQYNKELKFLYVHLKTDFSMEDYLYQFI